MAISQRSVGSWASVTTQTQTVTLPTHAAGDMILVRAVVKPYTFAPTITTSGWVEVAAGFANGSTANGNGTGSIKFNCWYKIATSDAETNPVIDWHTDTSTANPGAAVAVVYQCGASESFITPVGDGGGDATARTSQTATIQSHVSVTSGDLIDFFTSCCDNVDLTVPVLTQAGVTYNSTTEYPGTALNSTDGFDIAADGGYRTASSGTSSAAAVVTWTSSASEQGGAWMTRLRVAPFDTADAENAAGSGAAYAATAAVTSNAGNAAATGSIGGAAYSAEVLADSPVGYWRLGESSGYPQDSSGNGLHMTAGTATQSVSGLLTGDANTSNSFNGTSDYWQRADNDLLDLETTFTLEAWVQRGATGAARTILSKTTNAYGLDIWTGGTLRLVKANVGVILETTSDIGTGTHHVVATYDGVTAHLYVDGVEPPVGTQNTLTCENNTSAFSIGVDTDIGWFNNGTIDEVAVYGTVLSSVRVAAHYAAGTVRSAYAAIGPSAGHAAGTGSAYDATVETTGSEQADAELASGTGTAYAVAAAITVAVGLAAGVGAAYDATVQSGPSPDVAAGTGEAYAVSATIAANASLASGTGTAYAGGLAVTFPADVAAGTGTAYDVTMLPGAVPQAEVASGTGSGYDAQVSVGISAEAGAGAGAAYDATISTGVPEYADAELASGTGAAYDAGAGVGVSAEVAYGSGAAYDPSTALAISAGNAAGVGEAFDGTVTTSTPEEADAGLASGIGEALGPVADIGVSAEHAAGSGTAYDALAGPGAAPAAASGTGTAYGLSAAITVASGLPSGSGTAYDATVSTIPVASANAGHAAGTGTAYDATIAAIPVRTADADHASAVGASYDASVALTILADHAAGVGAAYDAVGRPGAPDGYGVAGTGVALEPTLSGSSSEPSLRGSASTVSLTGRSQ